MLDQLNALSRLEHTPLVTQPQRENSAGIGGGPLVPDLERDADGLEQRFICTRLGAEGAADSEAHQCKRTFAGSQRRRAVESPLA